MLIQINYWINKWEKRKTVRRISVKRSEKQNKKNYPLNSIVEIAAGKSYQWMLKLKSEGLRRAKIIAWPLCSFQKMLGNYSGDCNICVYLQSLWYFQEMGFSFWVGLSLLQFQQMEPEEGKVVIFQWRNLTNTTLANGQG